MQYFIGFVSPGSAEADSGCCGKLDSHLMASCVRNIRVKSYFNFIILQVTIKNVGDVFFSGHNIHFYTCCLFLVRIIVIITTYLC